MKLRGVPKGPLSSPKGLKFCLREMRLFSQSFSGSPDRFKKHKRRAYSRIATSISSPKCELGVIKYDCPT
jgi:hypothetical protein